MGEDQAETLEYKESLALIFSTYNGVIAGHMAMRPVLSFILPSWGGVLKFIIWALRYKFSRLPYDTFMKQLNQIHFDYEALTKRAQKLSRAPLPFDPLINVLNILIIQSKVLVESLTEAVNYKNLKAQGERTTFAEYREISNNCAELTNDLMNSINFFGSLADSLTSALDTG